MSRRTAVTVNRPREEAERLWRDVAAEELGDAEVTFKDAPGDRGTEIHVGVGDPPAGKLGEAVQKVKGSDPLAKAKDHLRRFKALVETGEIPRSDATPEGEELERKFKQRPAQPLEQAGAR